MWHKCGGQLKPAFLFGTAVGAGFPAVSKVHFVASTFVFTVHFIERKHLGMLGLHRLRGRFFIFVLIV